MIEAHPRFRAPQTLRVPVQYCGAASAPSTPASANATPPPPSVSRLESLQQLGVIATTHRAASATECTSTPGRELFTVTLAKTASTFHPTPLPDGRGWEFVLARRRFLTIDGITYDNPADPKMAHVQYAWTWEPELLGQLLAMGRATQGASATFLRDGNGWIVRQPGM